MNIKEANMKIGKLRQVNGFWNNLTFTGNMCRMRSALTNYLSEEGLKSRIEDGLVLFEFDDNHFCASFCMDEGYPECEITYEVEDRIHRWDMHTLSKPVFQSMPSIPLLHIAVLLWSAVFRQVYDAIWRNIHDSSSL